MQAFIDVSLNIFFVLMGLLMIYMAYKALTTIQGSKRLRRQTYKFLYHLFLVHLSQPGL